MGENLASELNKKVQKPISKYSWWYGVRFAWHDETRAEERFKSKCDVIGKALTNHELRKFV